jgi:hypothetical protein
MTFQTTRKSRRRRRHLEQYAAASLVPFGAYVVKKWREGFDFVHQKHRLDHKNVDVPYNPQLCSRCQKWNSPDSCFTYMAPDSWASFVPLQQILQNESCMICQMIGSLVLQQTQVTCQNTPKVSKIRVHVGSAYAFPENIDDRDELDENIVRSTLSHAVQTGKPIKCILYVRHRGAQRVSGHSTQVRGELGGRSLPSPDLAIQLMLSYQISPTQLIKIETWDTPYLDLQSVNSWLCCCENDHGDQCQNIGGELPTGFRLIDVEELCIVEVQDGSSFIALSYTWHTALDGNDSHLCQDNLSRLQTPGALNLQTLPDVIADAIRLCRAFGRRYLWIDRLCIVQDDSLSKHVQINAMDSIYGSAALTVVAAVDGRYVTGLPGIPGRPRPPFLCNMTRAFESELNRVDSNFQGTVDHSVWNKRGWTFQERMLSSRCLYITDYQAYFSCPKITFQEELGQVRARDDLADTNSFSKPGMLWIRNVNSLTAYLKLVSAYTARQLSYETDIMNAFAGVSRVVSKQILTPIFFGLPEKYFQQALLWHCTGPVIPRSGVPHIPSWSWASWLGPVHFKNLACFPVDDWDTGTLVKFHILQSERSLVPLKAEETWFGTSKNFSDKSCLDEDKIRAKFMPNGKTSASIWKHCIHNPWSSLEQVHLDPKACSLAEKYPGCLVFNTTVATLFVRRSKKKSVIYDESDSDSDNGDEDGGSTATASSGKAKKVSLDLCDKTHFKIGQMVMDRQWAKQKLVPNHEHCFIILCAYLLRKSRRRELLIGNIPLVGPWSRVNFLDYESERAGSVWLLIGMLVERQHGVARRLALGYVETRLWNRASPRWETVVLT